MHLLIILQLESQRKMNVAMVVQAQKKLSKQQMRLEAQNDPLKVDLTVPVKADHESKAQAQEAITRAAKRAAQYRLRQTKAAQSAEEEKVRNKWAKRDERLAEFKASMNFQKSNRVRLKPVKQVTEGPTERKRSRSVVRGISAVLPQEPRVRVPKPHDHPCVSKVIQKSQTESCEQAITVAVEHTRSARDSSNSIGDLRGGVRHADDSCVLQNDEQPRKSLSFRSTSTVNDTDGVDTEPLPNDSLTLECPF